MDEAKAILRKLENGHKVDESQISPALLPLFHPQVQGFLINELTFSPTKLIAGINKPILILQGLRDIQVNTADAKLLKMANPKAELKYLENTNHMLKTVESNERDANVKTYSNPSLPLANNVIESISAFIEKNE